MAFFYVGLPVYSQTQELAVLERKVYELNNKARYETSVTLLHKFLKRASIQPEEAFYGNLFLSYTYKRLYNYDAVFSCLEKAKLQALKTKNQPLYLSNYYCEKAFALFDVSRYREADSLMRILEKDDFKYLNAENQAKIIMQQAYLLFLAKKYAKAQILYDKALLKLEKASSCDCPMVLGKQIQLYAEMGNRKKMEESFRRSIDIADSCHIIKYKIYTVEMMKEAAKGMKDYKGALDYFDQFLKLSDEYKAKENIDKISELEAKYNAHEKEQQLALNQQTISASNRLIVLLITLIVLAILITMLWFTIQRRKKIERNRERTQRFAAQLLRQTEEERKRIAADLHDSIINELHLLSMDSEPTATKGKIDQIIDDIRYISRNLHPVLFDEIGLKDSVEHLVERMQIQHQFMLHAEINYQGALNIENELQIYRIIQEAITNMIKHANAVAGKVAIEQSEHKLNIEIRDNGNGFDVETVLKNHQSFGLHNIIERGLVMNGKTEIRSDKTGTIISIEIPLKQ